MFEIKGIIERRLLINFRVDPQVAKKLLPKKFSPQLIDGNAVVGICLIRLAAIRPSFLPSFIGLGSENAAHSPDGFFGSTHALDDVQVPMQIWSGTLDTITPPEQIEIPKQALGHKNKLDCHFIDGAGHFSFMNIFPPNIVDTVADREKFLNLLTNKVCRYVCDELVGQ
jgi:hypothetical protein